MVLELERRCLLKDEDLARFASAIYYSERLRSAGLVRLPQHDIVTFIEQARDEGDIQEAVWRACIGTHFGRLSGKGETATSAARFLCAFGETPRWSWQTVSADPDAFLHWLATEPRLATLRFGNHRKREGPKQLKDVWRRLDAWAIALREIQTPIDDPLEQFDYVMVRVKLYRFGRLARFDLLDLLAQLHILVAEPAHCYLRGATGPRIGAVRVWGRKRSKQLNSLTAKLAGAIGVSCFVLEDALCNFGKDSDEPTCCADPRVRDCAVSRR